MNIMKPFLKRSSASIGLLVFIVPLLIQSCQQGTAEEQNSTEAIKRQISGYRNQINTLTVKVNDLERELIARGVQTGRNAQTLVSVEKVDNQPFQNFFKTSGTVEAVNTATISPEINGHIRRVYVSKGDAVSRGQIVARLSASVIESNIDEIKTSLRLAETVYERQKRLWDQQIGSEIQYLEAKNNLESLQGRLKTLESQKDLSVLRAPITGFVDEIFIKEGELAMPGTPMMDVISLDELYINADISEAYLPYVTEGQSVIVRFPAWPGTELEVPVHRTGHVINPENRSFRMQLRIDNPDNRFKPNMMAKISIGTFSVENAIVVPSILIGYDAQGHYVFTAKEDGGLMIANKTYIDRGPDSEGKTMVNAGLPEGTLLITQGYHRITNGEIIRVENNQTR